MNGLVTVADEVDDDLVWYLRSGLGTAGKDEEVNAGATVCFPPPAADAAPYAPPLALFALCPSIPSSLPDQQRSPSTRARLLVLLSHHHRDHDHDHDHDHHHPVLVPRKDFPNNNNNDDDFVLLLLLMFWLLLMLLVTNDGESFSSPSRLFLAQPTQDGM